MIEPTVTIYGLFCVCEHCQATRPGEIRYVGQTYQNLRKRLRNHAADRHDSAKARWFSKHGPTNIRMFILDVVDLALADESEVWWIARMDTYRNGLNSTEGGGGARGYSHGISDRGLIGLAARRNRVHSGGFTDEEAREIKRRLWSGEACSVIARDYGTDTSRVGRIRAEITYADVPWPIGPRYQPPKRYRPKGVKRTAQSLEKARVSRGSLTDEAVREIRKLRQEGWSVNDLAEKFDRGKHTIYKIMRGKLYASVPD